MIFFVATNINGYRLRDIQKIFITLVFKLGVYSTKYSMFNVHVFQLFSNAFYVLLFITCFPNAFQLFSNII